MNLAGDFSVDLTTNTEQTASALLKMAAATCRTHPARGEETKRDGGEGGPLNSVT